MPTNTEFEALSNKKTKTTEERLIERKGNLKQLYGVEVTPELVKKDDDGWVNQLQLHYYLTVGHQYLAERDRRSLSQLSEWGNGKAFKPDINNRQLSAPIKALKTILIEQFLDPEKEFTASSLADWLEMVIQHRQDIHTFLGVSINPFQDTAIAVAQRILKKLGLQLECKHQVRINGKPTRVYTGCKLDSDGRRAIFEHWLNRDLSHSTVTPFSKEDIQREGVTAG